MAMDLPEAKGTYVLIAFVAQMKRLEIGRLGAYDIVPGLRLRRQRLWRWRTPRAHRSPPGINGHPALAHRLFAQSG
jgi:hypothetical protein